MIVIYGGCRWIPRKEIPDHIQLNKTQRGDAGRTKAARDSSYALIHCDQTGTYRPNETACRPGVIILVRNIPVRRRQGRVWGDGRRPDQSSSRQKSPEGYEKGSHWVSRPHRGYLRVLERRWEGLLTDQRRQNWMALVAESRPCCVCVHYRRGSGTHESTTEREELTSGIAEITSGSAEVKQLVELIPMIAEASIWQQMHGRNKHNWNTTIEKKTNE